MEADHIARAHAHAIGVGVNAVDGHRSVRRNDRRFGAASRSLRGGEQFGVRYCRRRERPSGRRQELASRVGDIVSSDRIKKA